MDALVEAALRKWPNVPHCHGWLALDARGDWYMRDDRIQAAGPFPAVKGSAIRHDKLREFIHRNYLRDEVGASYFQNGPQRVYVDLEAAPYVWRITRPSEGSRPLPVASTLNVTAHTGEPVTRVVDSWLDEQGRLFLRATLSSVGEAFGVVHSQDMLDAADAVEQGLWTPEPMPFADMPSRFGYVMRPH
jgi:hypothetical protein